MLRMAPRLMLKDLSILAKQKVVFLFPFILMVPIFGGNPVMTAVWTLFPVIMLVQTLDALNLKGEEHKLARSLPLSPAQAMGARYLLAPTLYLASAVLVFGLRMALKAFGAPVPFPEWGIAALGLASALGYYALLNPVQLKFGFAKSRWFNFAFVFLFVFSSSFLQTVKGGGATSFADLLRGRSLAAPDILFRPGFALTALAGAAALYALSFLLSCRIWRDKEIKPAL